MAMKAKELAQLMGVSAATMSLVLNNKPGISADLRNTLLKQVRDLGYGYMIKGESESEAEGLEKKIAYLIYPGCESGSDGTSFYAPVLEGVEREARRLGYELLVVHMDLEAEDTFLQKLGNECQGIVVQAQTAREEIEEQIARIGLPAVVTACQSRQQRALSVCINHEMGMEKAVAALAEKGHRRIGYVGVPEKNDLEKERCRYFKLAMWEAGLEAKDCWTVDADGQLRNGAGMCVRLDAGAGTLVPCESPAGPTALILEDDLLAPAVYRVLRRMGKRIPEDVSVIGFGGREICSLLDPPLSTVRVPRRFMGRMVMTMLEHRIGMSARGLENAGAHMRIDVDLVEMESVGACARE